MAKILLAANTDWYLYNFRLRLAEDIREKGASVTLVSPPGPYATRMKRMGFTWRPLVIDRRSANPLREAETLMGFLALFRREKPDLVGLFTIKPVIYGTLAARLMGVRSIVGFITGLGYLFVNSARWTRIRQASALHLYRLALRSSRVKVIFQNEADMKLFLEKSVILQDQGRVVPGSGVDPEAFIHAEEPAGKPVILFASRLLWDKGVGDLIQAAKILRQNGFSGRIILAGEIDTGNPSSIPRERMERWQAEGLVEWLGFCDDMPALLQAAHIVVLPSYYGEGVPRILIEAAVVGRPIVASDIPGCRVVVQHGVNGLLVPPRDPEALAAALQRLLSDPSLRANMGKAGRALVLRDLTLDSINSRILRVFEEVCPHLW